MCSVFAHTNLTHPSNGPREFLRRRQRLFPQEIHFGGRHLNNKISPEIFQNPPSWHISWGDTDLL